MNRKLIPTISEETISSSVYPNDSLEAAFIAAFISSSVTFSPLTTAIKIVVNDPVGTGTLCAAPI